MGTKLSFAAGVLLAGPLGFWIARDAAPAQEEATPSKAPVTGKRHPAQDHPPGQRWRAKNQECFREDPHHGVVGADRGGESEQDQGREVACRSEAERGRNDLPLAIEQVHRPERDQVDQWRGDEDSAADCAVAIAAAEREREEGRRKAPTSTVRHH